VKPVELILTRIRKTASCCSVSESVEWLCYGL